MKANGSTDALTQHFTVRASLKAMVNRFVFGVGRAAALKNGFKVRDDHKETRVPLY